MVDNFSFLAVVMSYCHCHFIVYSNIKHETCIPFHTSEFYSFPTDLNLSAVSLQILMINISPASCHLTLTLTTRPATAAPHHQMVTMETAD